MDIQGGPLIFTCVLAAAWIGIGVAIFRWAGREVDRAAQAWQVMADELGIDIDHDESYAGNQAAGTLDGRSIRVRSVGAKASAQGGVLTEITVHFASPLPAGLTVVRGSVTGAILTGAVEFDDRFGVAGDNADAVRKVLTPDVRAAAQALDQRFEFAIADNALKATVRGIINDSEAMVAAVRAQARLADVLARANASALSEIDHA